MTRQHSRVGGRGQIIRASAELSRLRPPPPGSESDDDDVDESPSESPPPPSSAASIRSGSTSATAPPVEHRGPDETQSRRASKGDSPRGLYHPTAFGVNASPRQGVRRGEGGSSHSPPAYHGHPDAFTSRAPLAHPPIRRRVWPSSGPTPKQQGSAKQRARCPASRCLSVTTRGPNRRIYPHHPTDPNQSSSATPLPPRSLPRALVTGGDDGAHAADFEQAVVEQILHRRPAHPAVRVPHACAPERADRESSNPRILVLLEGLRGLFRRRQLSSLQISALATFNTGELTWHKVHAPPEGHPQLPRHSRARLRL